MGVVWINLDWLDLTILGGVQLDKRWAAWETITIQIANLNRNININQDGNVVVTPNLNTVNMEEGHVKTKLSQTHLTSLEKILNMNIISHNSRH